MHQHTETEEPVHRIPKCELSPDDERLELTNSIQRILWDRMKQGKAATHPQPLDFIDWITQYSRGVREFYAAHAEEGFFIGWPESDDETADENKLQTIERHIYQ